MSRGAWRVILILLEQLRQVGKVQGGTVAMGEVDMPHMAVTTLGYLNTNVVPDRWTGWAGDLATAMGELQKLKNWNKDRQVNLDRAARGLVGQKDDYR